MEDRIENLVIGIKLYKKAEELELIDQVRVKWQTPRIISDEDNSTEKEAVISVLLDNDIKTEPESELLKINPHSGMAERLLEPIHHILNISENNDNIGVPWETKRWHQPSIKGIYSEMQFHANITNSDFDLYDTETIQVLLLRVQYFGNGNFVMTPDFNIEQKFKVKETNYQYVITNESEKIKDKDEQIEKLIFTEFYKRLQISRSSTLVDLEFESLESQTRLVYNCELSIAKGFQSANIYIHYIIELPKECKNESKISEGYTQTVCSTVDEETVWNFNVPIQISYTTTALETPVMYFKVVGIDYMDRQNIQGYGYLEFANRPGKSSFEIHTWKPLSNYQSKMKTYFLGGSPQLQQLEYLTKETKNRYGFQTESSGYFTFQYNCIIQEKGSAEIQIAKVEKKNGVSDALHRAKLRLDTLRQFTKAEPKG
ncbi:Pleiotropic negative transcriptional regulator [Boothiomyces sp. JEL0838]|nr:Pleiotropic negative transcriptional regulator [Boothiomyces sp. JEL0838]